MDAITFVKERRRMCDEHSACVGCPLSRLAYCVDAEPEELVKAVEEWRKEHPLYTNGRKFVEKYRDVITSTNREDKGNLVLVYMYADWWDAEYKGEEV